MTSFKKETVEQLKTLARECLRQCWLDFYTVKSARKTIINDIKLQKRTLVALESQLIALTKQFKEDPALSVAVKLPVYGAIDTVRAKLKSNRYNLKNLDIRFKNLKEKFVEINKLFDSLGFRVNPT